VRSKQDILQNTAQCVHKPTPGFRRVSLVEFLPLTTSATPSASLSKGAAPVPKLAMSKLAPATPAAKKITPKWTQADVGKRCPGCNRTVNKNDFCGKITYDCMC
jgi:hypothetical protein